MKNQKISAIIFDLDGVLLDAKQIHFNALNDAIYTYAPDCVISYDEHLSTYDGLKTYEKLQLLTENKGLSIQFYSDIWHMKQKITIEYLNKITPNLTQIDVLRKLKEDGFKIACCSNSINQTVFFSLEKLGILPYFDVVLSNEDILHPKPSPEIYWTAMIKLGLNPDKVLVLEDSPTGLYAAFLANAHIMRITSPTSVSYPAIISRINNIQNRYPKWINTKMNVLIPMAGAGSRFENAGYSLPKPLIDVNGKPMIQAVVDNLNVNANFIFIVQRSHSEKYNFKSLLPLIAPDCSIIEIEGMTEGAACTTLLAEKLIDNEQPLIISNCDQYIKWNSNEFFYKVQEQKVDASILTFNANHPKWSYAKVDNNGFVTEVAEKNPISELATVGIYFWKHGKDYVQYAKKMISENKRVNNEFYVCPVFNEAIEDNKKITTYNVDEMWGLGTPEDLETFLIKNNI
jgi:HAD superfamily hydrolase (TIGR01509 family)